MTTTMTLADLAANSLNAVRIMEQHGLDYCCGGKQPFDDACLAKGIKPESVLRQIEEAGRALTNDELSLIWAATDELGYPYGPLYRLLILTGQRRNDWADASRSEINSAAFPPLSTTK